MSDYFRIDSADGRFHIDGYERLRSSVMEPAYPAFRNGLAVLISRGVLAWMHNFQAPESRPCPAPSTTRTSIPHQAVMHVWADMIHPHLQAPNKTEAI